MSVIVQIIGIFITNFLVCVGFFIKIKIDIAKLQEQINAHKTYTEALRAANSQICSDHKSTIDNAITQLSQAMAEQRRYFEEMLKQNREDHNKLFDNIDKTNEKIDENFKIIIDKIS